MSAATDRDVAPTPNPTPPPVDLEMAVYGDGSAAAGSIANDDAPSRAACSSCANTAAAGGFAQTDCSGCASCIAGVEAEEDEEEPAPTSRAPSKEELLDMHRNVVLLLKAMKERSAKGAKRQGRYRKHDTARKNVVVSSIVSSTFEPVINHDPRSVVSVVCPVASAWVVIPNLIADYRTQVLPQLKLGKLPDETTRRMLFDLPGDEHIQGSEKTEMMDSWYKTAYTDPRSRQSTADNLDPLQQLCILLWAKAEGSHITAPAPLSAKRGAIPRYRFDFGRGARFRGRIVMAVARESP